MWSTAITAVFNLSMMGYFLLLVFPRGIFVSSENVRLPASSSSSVETLEWLLGVLTNTQHPSKTSSVAFVAAGDSGIKLGHWDRRQVLLISSGWWSVE